MDLLIIIIGAMCAAANVVLTLLLISYIVGEMKECRRTSDQLYYRLSQVAQHVGYSTDSWKDDKPGQAPCVEAAVTSDNGVGKAYGMAHD